MFRIDEAITNGDNLYKWNEEIQRMEFAYKDDTCTILRGRDEKGCVHYRNVCF